MPPPSKPHSTSYKSTQVKVDARIAPGKIMSLLSPDEVQDLLKVGHTELYPLFRRCTLAVLNSGAMEDDAKAVLEAHHNYDIEVIQQSRGIKLALYNAPETAFVDGEIIHGIREHLFSVLRDILYNHKAIKNPHKHLDSNTATTDAVFRVLRHADILKTGQNSPLIICWGGHSISRAEYEYTKKVGYELGLRDLNIGTGCGPGAMKGPMKGATIGRAKQHLPQGRFIGLTEPGIIAAEPPNPIVNELVILPDIEKRLEAFVRVGHGIIVFPGGVGTAEEILYLLGILLHSKNTSLPFPLIFTAPESSRAYFEHIDQFIKKTLGHKAAHCYEIIIGDAPKVARTIKKGITEVFTYRRKHKDAYYFNWLLNIPHVFQQPFEPTHEQITQLEISQDLDTPILAAHLRCIFSAVVSGNVKDSGIRRIEEQGPYKIQGDIKIMQLLDELLKSFVQQGRMKLGQKSYQPCYELVRI